MNIYGIVRRWGGTMVLLALAFFVTGCGSSTTGSTVASIPTAAACLSVATGTIQSISGSTLQGIPFRRISPRLTPTTTGA